MSRIGPFSGDMREWQALPSSRLTRVATCVVCPARQLCLKERNTALRRQCTHQRNRLSHQHAECAENSAFATASKDARRHIVCRHDLSRCGRKVSGQRGAVRSCDRTGDRCRSSCACGASVQLCRLTIVPETVARTPLPQAVPSGLYDCQLSLANSAMAERLRNVNSLSCPRIGTWLRPSERSLERDDGAGQYTQSRCRQRSCRFHPHLSTSCRCPRL